MEQRREEERKDAGRREEAGDGGGGAIGHHSFAIEQRERVGVITAKFLTTTDKTDAQQANAPHEPKSQNQRRASPGPHTPTERQAPSYDVIFLIT